MRSESPALNIGSQVFQANGKLRESGSEVRQHNYDLPPEVVHPVMPPYPIKIGEYLSERGVIGSLHSNKRNVGGHRLTSKGLESENVCRPSRPLGKRITRPLVCTKLSGSVQISDLAASMKDLAGGHVKDEIGHLLSSEVSPDDGHITIVVDHIRCCVSLALHKIKFRQKIDSLSVDPLRNSRLNARCVRLGPI